MGAKDQKVSKNKDLIAALPDKMEGVEMIFQGETLTVDLLKKTSKSGTSQYYTPISEDFTEDMIRMYFPQMGAAGFVPSESEVKELLLGESVEVGDLVSNAGKNYSMEFTFKPDTKGVGSGGKEMPFYGDWEKEFPNSK